MGVSPLAILHLPDSGSAPDTCAKWDDDHPVWWGLRSGRIHIAHERFECLLKADCRHMMTFVDDDHAVVADPRFDCVCVSKGLQQGNVDDAAAGISSTAVLSDQFAFLLRPRFFGTSGSCSRSSRNCERRSFHCRAS